MIDLNLFAPTGHRCQALLITASEGLDIVLVDLVEHRGVDSIFKSSRYLHDACEELLNGLLSEVNRAHCSWYLAERVDEGYKVQQFSIRLKKRFLRSSVYVHHHRWIDDKSDLPEKLARIVQILT